MSPPALAFILLSASRPMSLMPIQRTGFDPASGGLPRLSRPRSRLHTTVCSATPLFQNKIAEKAITGDVVKSFMSKGYAVVDNAISGEMAESALLGANAMRKNGKLSIIAEQFDLGRQDEMMVIDVWDPAWGPVPPDLEGMAEACAVLKGVAGAIARHCEPQHEWSKLCAPAFMQLAVYAGNGHRYVRHLDNDPDDERTQEGPQGLRVCDRVVTALLYFNKDWTEEDGGYIRLYSPEEGKQEEALVDLEPIAGRLVLFDSKKFFHEVLPTYRTRWALSAWMTDVAVE